MVRFDWPCGLARVPSDDWTHQPLETLALKYDTLERHGWYRNLDATVEDLDGALREGDVVLDYSGGTGILADRLLHRIGERRVGILIVDSSPKFLRMALEKFRDEERIALRLIRYLKERKRLEETDEVLPTEFVRRGVEAVVSTNAIHLYYDLVDTLRSWARVMRPGAQAFVQSGNIRNPEARPGDWIIDETVHAIHREAVELVRRDARYASYRAVLEDGSRLAAYEAVRNKFFLPVRPLDHYLSALREAGFEIQDVTAKSIQAGVNEWFEFLSVYHEGVLGWVGGSERVEGRPPSEAAVADRLQLLRRALDVLFRGAPTFQACWTYVRGRR